MKQRTLRHILSLFVSLVAVSAYAQESNILFETQKIDLGDTLYWKEATYPYYFIYENTGTAPLIVSKVIAHCPCIRVEYSTEPLPPAARDTIRVFFTPTHASKYSQRLSVFTNSPRNGIQLYAKGNFLSPTEMKKEEEP